MNEEEKKVKELEDAEAKAKVEADAKTKEDLSQKEEVDYKAIAEANEALALAEKTRADAAEALIIKNKSIAKREEKKNDDGTDSLTEEKVAEIVQKALAQSKEDDNSPEAKALEEANKNLAIQKAKTAEVARALKAKETVSKDSADTHFDPEKGTEPKLADNSPLKEFKFEGNGIYSKKLASGKTMYKNINAGPGQPKSWIA